jgi:copper chaperone CopZ
MLRFVADVREELRVDGVRCIQCVRKISTALTGSPGVVAASANLLGDVVVILAEDDDAARREVRRRLAAAGFPPVDD